MIKYDMKINVVTLFPQMFDSPFAEGVVGRAIKNGLIKIKTTDLRQWAWNSYGAVDDKPFGGGVGMIIRADVVGKALEKIGKDKGRVIALSAKGKRFDQKKAEELVKKKQLTLLCGRYEGFDQRVLDHMADEVISIGDYVLSGGEIAAMMIIDAIARLIPGVLGKDESSKEESFSEIRGKRSIERPQYTRPRDYKGWKVPEILLGGDHKKIEEWKKIRSG